jgi:hypothetical protein
MLGNKFVSNIERIEGILQQQICYIDNKINDSKDETIKLLSKKIEAVKDDLVSIKRTIESISKKYLKIAVLSLADIDNYGDIFFPYMFRAELLKRLPEAQVDLFTNNSFDGGVYKTLSFQPTMLNNYNTIILAGGDTIQRLDEEVRKPIYAKLYGNTIYGGASI